MPHAQDRQPVIFRNNAPVAAWIFVAVWMAMLCWYSYIYIRDFGGELDWMGPLLLFFWGVGFYQCRQFLRQPRVRVEIDRHSVLTRESFPWSTREDRFAVSALSVSDVIESKDGEGDPYYRCDLKLPGNRGLTIAESGSRPKVDAAREHLLAALRLA